jgi:hypothetical protein
MSDSKEMISMRRMQWKRARGEVEAVLETFWPEYDRDGKEIDHGFKEINSIIKTFIKDMDDNLP